MRKDGLLGACCLFLVAPYKFRLHIIENVGFVIKTSAVAVHRCCVALERGGKKMSGEAPV